VDASGKQWMKLGDRNAPIKTTKRPQIKKAKLFTVWLF
jgi:hypothetical protein